MPRFSIIIPVFNAEKTLSKSVESIRLQVYSDFEIIIVNDGSTDNSAVEIERLIKLSKIKVITQQNSGVSAARNAGANLAQGEWLLFLDSDDELAESALIKFSEFTSNTNLSLIRGGFIRRSAGSEYARIPDGKTYISPLAGSFCVRRTSFLKLGGYDERLKFSENSELFHRFFLANFVEVYISDYFFFYNDTKKGGSGNLVNSTESIELVLNKHDLTLPKHSKFLYYRVLGVNYLRFRDFKNSRRCFKNALKLKPLEVGTLFRYCLSSFPILAKKLYSTNVPR